MKIKWLLFISALLALFARSAEAQEKVVHLQRGSTVVSLLTRHEGCTPQQATRLWRLVFKDSGLETKDQRSLPTNQPIAIKRDCDGSLYESTTGLKKENDALNKIVNGLRTDLKEAGAQNATLTHENSELRAKMSAAPASHSWLSLSHILPLVLALVVGAGLVAFPVHRKMKASADAATASAKGNLVFPMEIAVEHFTKEYVFKRFTKPNECKVGYVCPICGAHISSPHNAKSHMREAHKDEGRIEFETVGSGNT